MRRTSLIVLVLSGVMAGQSLDTHKTWIPLIVKDTKHEPIASLDPASLIVKYGKSQVNDLQLVSAAHLPLRLGILIDVSGSEKSRIASLIPHIKDFVLAALQSPEDRVFFATFNDERAATGWLTREQVTLLSGSPRTGGGTAIYDAVVSACMNRMGFSGLE